MFNVSPGCNCAIANGIQRHGEPIAPISVTAGGGYIVGLPSGFYLVFWAQAGKG